MRGYLCILLHAHLPFVRHPEHPKFLEENWLFEAITETYIPLLRLLGDWERDGLNPRLTITLSPTLCAMLRDPLLQERYLQHLDNLLELADKEIHRTYWEPAFHDLARFYFERLEQARAFYCSARRNLVGLFRGFEQRGSIEIITTSATHAVLPLLARDLAQARGQIMAARDFHKDCFGSEPRGFWLPECAFAEEIEGLLAETNLRWFVVDTHGLLHARPRPVYAVYAPIITPCGLAAFARDPESAQQVWSRHQGYPGDFAYRDFYRDIGFDLEKDYLTPHMASGARRTFTGFKYYRITGTAGPKRPYDRTAALAKAQEHGRHFLQTRADQAKQLAGIMKREPVILAPYDAELFGHWWYEGPDFLDAVVRGVAAYSDSLKMCTPEEYLAENPRQQVAMPSASSWGEAGYWRVWLNEENEWIYRSLHRAHCRMEALLANTRPETEILERALKQATRELLLAQSSDWPFIIRAGTSPEYAKKRVFDHLAHFSELCDQIESGTVSFEPLSALEERNNLFPNLKLEHWKVAPPFQRTGAV